MGLESDTKWAEELASLFMFVIPANVQASSEHQRTSLSRLHSLLHLAEVLEPSMRSHVRLEWDTVLQILDSLLARSRGVGNILDVRVQIQDRLLI